LLDRTIYWNESAASGGPILEKGINMKNLDRRLSKLEECTRNFLHDLSDDELARRIKKLEKREYAILPIEKLKEKILEIEDAIEKRKGLYDPGTKELLERIANGNPTAVIQNTLNEEKK
jgi:hypothetical protein